MADTDKKDVDMKTRYYNWVDKKSDDGGRMNLWLNNAAFAVGGMFIESKLNIFGDKKSK
jgi:hypothetical protein